MIDSYTATIIIISFLVVCGIILPILDKIPVIKNIISLRWTLVVIYSSLCLGVIINFSHLDTSVRLAVIIGGVIISVLFIFVRSLEKAAVNKWKFPRVRTKVQKGDVSGELSVSSKINDDTKLKELSKYVTSQPDEDYETVMNEAMFGQINKEVKK